MKNYLINKVNEENYWILFLHGWGQRKESLLNIALEIKDKYNYILIDLPFSSSFTFSKAYKIESILEYLNKILNQENIAPSLIIGHSCGGKIAISYTLRIKETPLILLAPSILKPPFSLKRYLKIKMYKICKKLVKKQIISHIPSFLKGSNDNQIYSYYLKKTFLKMVNTYFDNELKYLTNKISIIIGKDDYEVPNKKIKKLSDKYPNIKIYEVEGNHFAYKRHVLLIQKLIEDTYGNHN